MNKNNIIRIKRGSLQCLLVLANGMACLFTLASCANNVNPNKTMSSATNPATPPAGETTDVLKTDTASFGTGCFWCSEALFQELEGVLKVTSGYSGGHVANPTYEAVCSKTTGHAEVIEVVYDPAKITYDELLEVFWKTHDPTTLNRQGNDIGPQYRSVIFFHNDLQRQKAEHYKTALNKSGAYDKPIITAIEPFKNFYSAEKYHQNYFNNNGSQPYCQLVIRPKVEKFEKVFKDKLRHN